MKGMKHTLQQLAARLSLQPLAPKALDATAKQIEGQLLKFRQTLSAHGNEENAKQMQAYMKGIDFKFHGILTKIRTDDIFKPNYDHKQPFFDRFALAVQLLKSEYFDEKLLAVSILENSAKDVKQPQMEVILSLIREGHICGWALSDSLAKAVRLAALQHGSEFDDYMIKWSLEKDNTWVRRVSCVSFVVRAKHGDKPPKNYPGFMNKMYSLCQQCLKYDERFNQLGVGWLLRQMSVADTPTTIAFIKRHRSKMINEAVRYAVEKLGPEQKQEIAQLARPKKLPHKRQEKLKEPKVSTALKQKNKL